MVARIKINWLAALASKQYRPHATGLLATAHEHGPTSYSALGVLYELAARAGVQVGPIEDDQFCLPAAVAQWAEMDALPWMRIAQPSGIHNLAYLNKLGSGTFDLEAAAINSHL